MKAASVGCSLSFLLVAAPALADQVTDEPVHTVKLDPDAQREVRRQTLQTEYLILEDARTTTFGSDFGTEGRLLTIRFPLYSWQYEQAQSLLPRPLRRYQRMLEGSQRGAIQDDVMAALPPFRLTFSREGETVWGELGAIESTLGHGSLVNRYTNNPRGGLSFDSMGVVLGAQAKSVGGSIMTGNLLQPGRFIGFNVKGRPLEWIYGTYSNAEPEFFGNFDYYALLLSALTIGVSGAFDTEAARSAINFARTGDEPSMPGTAGGLSVEADVGLNHSILQAHIYANATALARSFEEATLGADGRATTGHGTSALFGAGITPGVRFNLMLEMLKIGGALEYRLAGPNYTPAYFDRYYEGDRTATPLGVPKISARSMSRHGYSLQLGAQAFKTLGVFWEMSDLVQLDPRFGKNDATMRVGGIVHLLGVVSFLGAYVNRGFQDYARAFEPSTGGMWLGEVRLSLFCFSIVGRRWRSFERLQDGATIPRNGGSLLAEFQLGIL
jgi:hypothetical protein